MKKCFQLSKKGKEISLKSLQKYRKIVQLAKERGLNESDTSNIINEILGEILGYNKFFDVTTEYKIKGQFCDFGVKINNKLAFS